MQPIKFMGYFHVVITPLLAAMVVGFISFIIGDQYAIDELDGRLMNNVVGHIIIAGNLFLLAFTEIAKRCVAVNSLKDFIKGRYLTTMMAGIAGLVAGFALYAICKENYQWAIGMILTGAYFLGVAWVFLFFENLILLPPPKSPKEKLISNISCTGAIIGGLMLLCGICNSIQ